MNSVSINTSANYANYSTYVNKENVSSIINQPVTTSTKAVEEDNSKVEQVNESRRASNEEIAALYFNTQANETYNNIMNILFEENYEDSEDENTHTHEDMRKLYVQKSIAEYAGNQNSKSSFEVWA